MQDDVDVISTTTGEATEATVIESGPMEKATAEAWSAAPAAEAMVMEEGTSNNGFLDSESKPPAMEHSRAWRGRSDISGDNYHSVPLDSEAGQQAEATVVDYDLHPSETSADAVQAEFIGQDYNTSLGYGHSMENTMPSTEVSHVAELAHEAVDIDGNSMEEATEATVIESGPMEKATAEAWSAAPAEEAQVLEDDTTNTIVVLNSKPPAADESQLWGAGSFIEGRFIMADREAEVVGITEEIHPSEYVEDAAEAELIGPDFNCAIAEPSGLNSAEGVLEEAEIIVAENTEVYGDTSAEPQTPIAEPQEAQATLVCDGEFPTGDSTTAQHVSSITTVLDGDYSRRDPSDGSQPATTVTVLAESTFDIIVDPQPATPVTILEQSNVDNADPTCFTKPQRPVPISNRAISAPTTLPSTIPFVYDPRDTPALSRDGLAALDAVNEPGWTRAPSFGGESSDDLPTAIPPPLVSATEAQLIEGEESNHVLLPPPIPRPCSPIASVTTGSRASRSSSTGISDSSACQSGNGLQTVSLDCYLYSSSVYS
jgi:hypothetical protein